MTEEKNYFYGSLKDIKITDNFFKDETYTRIVDYIDKTYNNCKDEYKSETHWEPGHVSDGQLGQVSWFWMNKVDNIKLFNTDILKEIEENLDTNFELIRVYFNGMNFGQNAQFHFDDDRKDTYTLLSYILPIYNMEWGGQTVFIDKDKKDMSTLPIPNRAVLFPSRIIHKAQPFNDPTAPMRVSLAYKLQLKK